MASISGSSLASQRRGKDAIGTHAPLPLVCSIKGDLCSKEINKCKKKSNVPRNRFDRTPQLHPGDGYQILGYIKWRSGVSKPVARLLRL